MGLYALRPLEGNFDALLQGLYSAIKFPLLLMVSTLICLPSFYVINTVARTDGPA